MSERSNIIRLRDRFQRSKMTFVGAVLLVAGVAFGATLMWPRSIDPVRSGDDAVLLTHQAQPASASGRSHDFECEVAYVNDGDTLRCGDGTRVRLHAIAARETDNSCSPGHPCPPASTSLSRSSLIDLAGRKITCARTGTSHDRVTAICWNSAGVEINCAMVRSGAAVVWERFNQQEPICQP